MNSFNPGEGQNRYELLDLIGSGGMAEVYKCKLSGQRGFEKLLVMKKLHGHVAKDPEIVSNFIDEARLAALLEHENIATIYDFGEMDGSYFIVMEYLFGKDLHAIMAKAREGTIGMDVEMALLIGAKICEAMEYAHTLRDLQQRPLNIIHRDLSPHNVFITYEGKVKIIDFGIAKAELFDNRTRTGVVKGKVSYMSPEQLSGGDIDFRSDIFAIAILLYEMLSGRRMYSGDTATLIRKCMAVEYQPLEKIVPDLAPQIYELLHKGLARERKERYQSCQEMLADIDDCLFAITKRPTSQRLKVYVRSLFTEEFAAEKTSLFAQASRWATLGEPAEDDMTRVMPSAFDDNTPLAQNDGRDRGGASGTRRRVRLLAPLLLFVAAAVIGYVILASRGGQGVSDPLPVASTQMSPKTPTAAVVVKEAAEKEDPGSGNNQLKTLFVEARKALAEQRLTLPESDSAYTYFSRILALDPENSQAKEGIRTIGEKYGRLAEKALLTDNFTEALGYTQKGLLVTPENGELLSLQKKAVAQRQQRISVLAEKARAALDQNDLTSPEGNCAYDWYRQILRLDPQNLIALNGMQAIGDRYAFLADRAYRNLQFTRSKMFVQRGLDVVPDHWQLKQLQRDLTRSKPGILFKTLEKNFSSLIKQ